jgi:hypothetical protein
LQARGQYCEVRGFEKSGGSKAKEESLRKDGSIKLDFEVPRNLSGFGHWYITVEK